MPYVIARGAASLSIDSCVLCFTTRDMILVGFVMAVPKCAMHGLSIHFVELLRWHDMQRIEHLVNDHRALVMTNSLLSTFLVCIA